MTQWKTLKTMVNRAELIQVGTNEKRALANSCTGGIHRWKPRREVFGL